MYLDSQPQKEQNSYMRNIGMAGIAFSIALVLATCDLKAARDVARVIFLEPEPGLSRPDFRKPGTEGIINKPEDIPSIRRER